MRDHDAYSLELMVRVFDGVPEGLTRDEVLDNVSVYWFTNTAVSSARLYWDSSRTAKSGFFDPRKVTIPVAVSAFMRSTSGHPWSPLGRRSKQRSSGGRPAAVTTARTTRAWTTRSG